MFTIISIPGTQAISAMTIETKPRLSTKFLGKGKEMEEEIDLDEEILIPNWDISKLNPEQCKHLVNSSRRNPNSRD